MDLKDAIDAVRSFQGLARQPAPDKFVPLSPERRKTRASWMEEEVREFLKADEFTDQVDALVDLLYFLLGSAVEMGMTDLSEPLMIVHRANVLKVQERSQHVVLPDGKAEKPPGWVDPRPDLAKYLAQHFARRRLVPADALDCVPAALVMALDALHITVSLDAARAAFPRATSVDSTVGPEEAGIQLGPGVMEAAVARLAVPAAVSFTPADRLWEGNFLSVLEESRATGEVLVGVDISVIDPDVRPFGHVFVLDEVGERTTRLIDPGPKTEGVRFINSDLLYAAIARKGVGMWTLRATPAHPQDDPD